MVFESWEAQSGVVVLHGNMKKNQGWPLFIYLVFFVLVYFSCVSQWSKLPSNPTKVEKLRLKNEAKAKNETGYIALSFFFTLP